MHRHVSRAVLTVLDIIASAICPFLLSSFCSTRRKDTQRATRSNRPHRGQVGGYRRTIADVVYDKMIEFLGVPEDRFQTINEHKAENFLFDPDYLSLYRSENCIFIQLIFLDVASPEQKAAFYKAVVDQLQQKLQVRREDVFFNLITVQPADWSMGNGQATYINGVPTDRLDPNSVES
jgi:4-oxalocrotonate tautomerase